MGKETGIEARPTCAGWHCWDWLKESSGTLVGIINHVLCVTCHSCGEEKVFVADECYGCKRKVYGDRSTYQVDVRIGNLHRWSARLCAECRAFLNSDINRAMKSLATGDKELDHGPRTITLP